MQVSVHFQFVQVLFFLPDNDPAREPSKTKSKSNSLDLRSMCLIILVFSKVVASYVGVEAH